VQIGEVLAGKYRVDRVLGEGGMGVVVAAHHLQLDTRVAIKFLLPAMLSAPEAVARFTREARAASKITSEHVARVRDVGTLDTGAPYMVMEFLDGGDLAAWLQQRGRLDVGQAVDFVLQASEAIAEAHSLGIVHRDLKPANLFCLQRADGLLSIKVLDFGISKVSDANDGSVTKTTAVMGSPLYMSPEQMTSSRDVDHRTDIYSLGVILFELLTGAVPFRGDSFPEICVKIATQPAPPLRSFRPEAPEALDAVVKRCLEKDRTKRFGSIGELAQALAPFAPEGSFTNAARISRVGSGTDPRITGGSAGYAGQALATSDAGLGRTDPNQKGKTNMALVGSLAALGVAVIVGGVIAMSRHGAPPPESAAAASQPSQIQGAAAAPSSAPVNPGAELAPAPAVAQLGTPSAQMAAAPATPQAAPHGAPAAAPKPGHAAANPPAANPPAAAPQAAAPAKPAVKPGCDPNYTLDAIGEKHWKKECF
jgi:serine/threonine-protein kinase